MEATIWPLPEVSPGQTCTPQSPRPSRNAESLPIRQSYAQGTRLWLRWVSRSAALRKLFLCSWEDCKHDPDQLSSIYAVDMLTGLFTIGVPSQRGMERSWAGRLNFRQAIYLRWLMRRQDWSSQTSKADGCDFRVFAWTHVRFSMSETRCENYAPLICLIHHVFEAGTGSILQHYRFDRVHTDRLWRPPDLQSGTELSVWRYEKASEGSKKF